LSGLCGFNGAGKSTLFNLRARSGVARTWQTVRLAHGQTALDNVAAAALRDPRQSMIGALWRPQAAPARERARASKDDFSTVINSLTPVISI
jgi:ABC-type branched-subunit amino acid transport system ATPase component